MAQRQNSRLNSDAEYSFRDSMSEDTACSPNASLYMYKDFANSKEKFALDKSLSSPSSPNWTQRLWRGMTVRKLLFRLAVFGVLIWAISYGGQEAHKNYKIVPKQEKPSTGFHAQWQQPSSPEPHTARCRTGKGLVINAYMDDFFNVQRLVQTFSDFITDYRDFRFTFLVDNDWLKSVLDHRLGSHKGALDFEVLTLQDAINMSAPFTGFNDTVNVDMMADFGTFGSDSRFRIATVRKLYGSLASGCAQTLYLGPETRFVRKGRLGDAFKRYFGKPYIITSHINSTEAVLRGQMLEAANKVYGVGEDLMEDTWFAEYFHLFADRRLTLGLFDRVQEYHGDSLYNVIRRQGGMVWEFALLYTHAYLHRTDFPEYQFIDQRDFLATFLKPYPGAWEQYRAESQFGTGSMEEAPSRLTAATFDGLKNAFNYLGLQSFKYENWWPSEAKRMMCDFARSVPSLLMQTESEGRWPPLDRPCDLSLPPTNAYGSGIEIKRPLPPPPPPPPSTKTAVVQATAQAVPVVAPLHPHEEMAWLDATDNEESEWMELQDEEDEWVEFTGTQPNRRPNNWSRIPASEHEDDWQEVMRNR